MPGLITHYICGQTVLNKLDPELQKIIKKYPEIYNMGTQGPDIFFYYLPGLIKKNTQDLGLVMHKSNTQKFIGAMLESSKKLEGDDKDIATAYICGYLTHYSLDCNTHPYIYYKTGFRRKGDMLNAPKYSIYHRKFETSIDVILLKLLSGERPSDKKLWQLLKLENNHEQVLGVILSDAIEKAYDRNISSEKIANTLKYITYITKFLQSSTGKRKKIMELVEDLTIGEHRFSSLVHLQDVTDKLDYLNLDKKTWHNPWDDEVANNQSFIELYNKGVEEGATFANDTFKYLNDKTSYAKLVNTIGNRSLASGLDCDLDLKWKFHDIIFTN